MYDDASGEIKHTPFLQNAAAPHHVDEREINQQQPSGEKPHVRLERDAIRESTGDQCGCNYGEHHLISDEHHERNRIIRR